jgi:hypothetical protein
MSIYGRAQGKPIPIYGISKVSESQPCGCPGGMNALLSNMVMMFKATQRVINAFFPTANAFAPIVADMNAEVSTEPFIFVRLVWAYKNPGKAFNKTSYRDLIDLLDIYYQYLMDPTTDPLPLYDLLAAATDNTT